MTKYIRKFKEDGKTRQSTVTTDNPASMVELLSSGYAEVIEDDAPPADAPPSAAAGSSDSSKKKS